MSNVGPLTPEMLMGALSALVGEIRQLNQNVVVLNQSVILLRKELADVEPAAQTSNTPRPTTLQDIAEAAKTLGVSFIPNQKPPRRS